MTSSSFSSFSDFLLLFFFLLLFLIFHFFISFSSSSSAVPAALVEGECDDAKDAAEDERAAVMRTPAEVLAISSTLSFAFLFSAIDQPDPPFFIPMPWECVQEWAQVTAASAVAPRVGDKCFLIAQTWWTRWEAYASGRIPTDDVPTEAQACLSDSEMADENRFVLWTNLLDTRFVEWLLSGVDSFANCTRLCNSLGSGMAVARAAASLPVALTVSAPAPTTTPALASAIALPLFSCSSPATSTFSLSSASSSEPALAVATTTSATRYLFFLV
jgi:hypothetical protein